MGENSLQKCSWSHDQDGCHVHLDKNPLKIFCGTKSQCPWGFVNSIGDVGSTKFAQMMILGLH